MAYTNTVFTNERFNELWESDRRGVKAEAKARGPQSKLARKVAAKTGRKLTVVTPTVKAKVKAPRTPANPAKQQAWSDAVATGAPVGSAEFWATYKEFRSKQNAS